MTKMIAPQGWLSPQRMLETLACFGFAFLTGQAIFQGWFHLELGDSARAYWMFIFVVWSAVRFGLHGCLLVWR